MKNKAILLTLKFHYAPETVGISEMEVALDDAESRIDLRLGARNNNSALCSAHDAIESALNSTCKGGYSSPEDYMKSVHDYFRVNPYFTKNDYMSELGLINATN